MVSVPKRQRTGREAPQTRSRLGPSSMEESDLWPIRILDRLKEKQFLEPLQQCFQSGVILTTDYSGIGTAEEATRHLCVVAALAEEAQGSPMTHELEEIVGQRLFVQRCGDKDAACREILLTHSGASCCVHGDIESDVTASFGRTCLTRSKRFEPQAL